VALDLEIADVTAVFVNTVFSDEDDFDPKLVSVEEI